ncbi:DUF7503 family protein [Natronoglomus mannanivorans]|uniref:Uncharacterized protein n=1 Tax=Natronoglomus mannanivorans TaxID=2979990 RepID=A0AAP3E411_9EURY|nr:hypothetical protein [Halobacteria archaeon AArc-xg1-1]
MSNTNDTLRSYLAKHPRVMGTLFSVSLLLSQAVVTPFGNGGVIS